jgi:hypothetical protein
MSAISTSSGFVRSGSVSKPLRSAPEARRTHARTPRESTCSRVIRASNERGTSLLRAHERRGAMLTLIPAPRRAWSVSGVATPDGVESSPLTVVSRSRRCIRRGLRR